MYPLKFHPFLRPMVWGGDKIAAYKGIENAPAHIGESWEISGYPGHESVVANGALAGRNLNDLVREYKGQLVGGKVYAAYGDQFPLLIKFIDARDDLSIQVHPDDRLAAERHPGSKGKTEMWYVVKADPGAYLLSGINTPITPVEYVKLVAENRITEVLERFDIRPGDVFFLPAGRIHAIGAGSFVAEIQQTSDLTYRIYDYNRPGLDGKPRQLHTEEAKAAIDYKVYPDYKTEYDHTGNRENVLVDCPYFTTSLYTLDKPVAKDLSGIDSFLAVICLAGRGRLQVAIPAFADGPTKGHVINVRRGECVLVPAEATSIVFRPDTCRTVKLLTSYIR